MASYRIIKYNFDSETGELYQPQKWSWWFYKQTGGLWYKDHFVIGWVDIGISYTTLDNAKKALERVKPQKPVVVYQE